MLRKPIAKSKPISRKPVPEQLARDVIAHEEEAPCGKGARMTFRVVLPRAAAEVLAARSIREEKNLPQLVTEILEAYDPCDGRVPVRLGILDVPL